MKASDEGVQKITEQPFIMKMESNLSRHYSKFTLRLQMCPGSGVGRLMYFGYSLSNNSRFSPAEGGRPLKIL